MGIGYLPCVACGVETNCVELTAGLCPACKGERVKELSRLHRIYDKAIAACDGETASLAVEEIAQYERVWGVRLVAAPSVEAMRRALAVGAQRAGGGECGC